METGKRVLTARRAAVTCVVFIAALGVTAWNLIPVKKAAPEKAAPVYPTEDEVRELLRLEPFTRESWPGWSARLRAWLPASAGACGVAYDEADKFLEPEFNCPEPSPPMRDDAIAWYIRGRSALQHSARHDPPHDRGRAAESLFRRSLHHDSSLGRVHHDLAVALYLRDNGDFAPLKPLPEADRAAELGELLDPTTCAEAAKAEALWKRGRIEEAIPIYTKILKERPYDVEIHRALEECRSIVERFYRSPSERAGL
jgi:hypothetical protein